MYVIGELIMNILNVVELI